jgi:predicted metal-dependent hydrolase
MALAQAGMVSVVTSGDNDAPHDLWWNEGNAFRSRLFDAISLLLPSGEKFVITVASDWLSAQPQSHEPDAQLRLDVQRFIREEVAHSRAHRLYNERLALHAPAKALEQGIASAMEEMAHWGLPTRIAFAAAFEYLTALLSVEVIRPRSVWIGDGTAPQIRLWQWHAQEEIGHRHVMAHIMATNRVGYGRRTISFLAAALYIGWDLTVSLFIIFRFDIQNRRLNIWRLISQAATFAVSALPSLLRMVLGCVRYLIVGRPAQ